MVSLEVDARPNPPQTNPSIQESQIVELKREAQIREAQISILREELKQRLLLRKIRVGLAVFVAVFLLVLVYLLTRETPDSLYLVQALGLKLMATLLTIGILAASYYYLSSDDDG